MADLAIALGSADARVLIPRTSTTSVYTAPIAPSPIGRAGLRHHGFGHGALPLVRGRTADLMREQPGLDLGVHLTLTSSRAPAAGGRSPRLRSSPV